MVAAMAPWLPPALLAALFVAIHYLTLRPASNRVGEGLGALAVEASAAVGLLAYVLASPAARTIERGWTRSLGWGALSGLCISTMMVLLFTALRRGGPISATGPLVLGGGVALSSLAAPLLFGEDFTLRRAIGVGLGLASRAVLATERS